MAKQPDTCDHEGCEQLGDIYRYSDGHLAVFCAAHAAEAGFCPYCGSYVRGCEEDDLALILYGMCDECADEVEEDLLPVELWSDWDETIANYEPDED